MRALTPLLLLALLGCPTDPVPCDDGDGDGFCNEVDACDGDGAGDVDQDGVCDLEDACLGDDASGDADEDGLCDDREACMGADADEDGVCDGDDACAGNDATGDADADGVCDDSDPCFGDQATGDLDEDGVCADQDVCNGDDASGDLDADGICDDLDPCFGNAEDGDGDGLCDDLDGCWGDNTSGDADRDGVCDDVDPCEGYAWCWEVALDVTDAPIGDALDDLVGTSLFVRLGVDDGAWTVQSGFASSSPAILEATGSTAAAQTFVDGLDTAVAVLAPNGDLALRLVKVQACPTDQPNLVIDAETEWSVDLGEETVNLGPGAWTVTGRAELRDDPAGGPCQPSTIAQVTGDASLTALDGEAPR